MDVMRADGWYSILTGQGTARDKSQSLLYQAKRLSYQQLLELWEGDDMAARIVEIWPDEMLRRGWSFITADDKEGMEDVSDHLERIGLRSALHRAISNRRGLGGGAILLGANDGSPNLSTPLDPSRVVSLDWVTVLDPQELRPSYFYSNPLAPKCGEPSHYTLTSVGGGLEYPTGEVDVQRLPPPTISDIHESRFLVFNGIQVSKRRWRSDNNGWGQSVLNRVWDVLSGFNQSWGGAWGLMSDFSQGIYKIKGLAEMVKKDDGKLLQKRLASIDLAKSYLRALALDMDLESYERLTTSLAGLSDVLDRANLRLAAAADMPLIMLMGDSPGGLGSTGAAEIRSFYGRVATKQTNELAPAISRVVDLLARLYDIQPGYKVVFPSLWQPTELETAQARNVQMLTDTGYINASVLFSDEVAKARFGGAEYSFETPVDLDARAELLGGPVVSTSAEVDVPPVTEQKPSIANGLNVSAGVDVQQTALNGARVSSLLEVIQLVTNGVISRASGKSVMMVAFQVSSEDAEALLGPSEFKPAIDGSAKAADASPSTTESGTP